MFSPPVLPVTGFSHGASRVRIHNQRRSATADTAVGVHDIGRAGAALAACALFMVIDGPVHVKPGPVQVIVNRTMPHQIQVVR